MTSFGGQASWEKMTSLGGKLTGLARHPTKFVKKLSNKPFSLQTLLSITALDAGVSVFY
jgi:hypothetical protein